MLTSSKTETTAEKSCCCNYGAAVSGEWPEFECTLCPVHRGEGIAGDPALCRRHRRAK